MSLSEGGKLFTILLPIIIFPDDIPSKPAIILKRVDFPQPEGPTSTTNSPSSISISNP